MPFVTKICINLLIRRIIAYRLAPAERETIFWNWKGGGKNFGRLNARLRLCEGSERHLQGIWD